MVLGPEYEYFDLERFFPDLLTANEDACGPLEGQSALELARFVVDAGWGEGGAALEELHVRWKWGNLGGVFVLLEALAQGTLPRLRVLRLRVEATAVDSISVAADVFDAVAAALEARAAKG